jgi:nucleotide-binding universal stress UspA family protein
MLIPSLVAGSAWALAFRRARPDLAALVSVAVLAFRVFGIPGRPVQPATSGGPAAPVSMIIGFDNSAPARRALAWAARFAASHPVALHVIYADHVIIDSDLSGFAHAEMASTRDAEARAVKQAAAQIFTGAGVPYTFERRQGAPADAILTGAGVPHSGLPTIVGGRAGHAAHHLLGSVPVRLLHRSPYPVLTIP